MHHSINELHLDKTIYMMNHYTANVILNGDRTEVRRQSLSKVHIFSVCMGEIQMGKCVS